MTCLIKSIQSHYLIASGRHFRINNDHKIWRLIADNNNVVYQRFQAGSLHRWQTTAKAASVYITRVAGCLLVEPHASIDVTDYVNCQSIHPKLYCLLIAAALSWCAESDPWSLHRIQNWPYPPVKVMHVRLWLQNIQEHTLSEGRKWFPDCLFGFVQRRYFYRSTCLWNCWCRQLTPQLVDTSDQRKRLASNL